LYRETSKVPVIIYTKKYAYTTKMDIRIEALLRSIGLFLSVYFTIGWGEKSSPPWDVTLMVGAVASAMALKYYD